MLRDGTRYLPDFYIHEWDAWFEVKPTTDRQFAHSYVHTLSMLRRFTHTKNAYVAFGAPDLIRGSYIVNDCCVFTHCRRAWTNASRAGRWRSLRSVSQGDGGEV